MFFWVPLPTPTAVRPQHCPENETCYVWKRAAVKQPSVHSLPLKLKRFIPAMKNPLRFQPLVRARPSTISGKRPQVFRHFSQCKAKFGGIVLLNAVYWLLPLHRHGGPDREQSTIWLAVGQLEHSLFGFIQQSWIQPKCSSQRTRRHVLRPAARC